MVKQILIHKTVLLKTSNLNMTHFILIFKAIDAGIKVASHTADQKLHDANAYVDGKRQELQKVLLNIFHYLLFLL